MIAIFHKTFDKVWNSTLLNKLLFNNVQTLLLDKYFFIWQPKTATIEGYELKIVYSVNVVGISTSSYQE